MAINEALAEYLALYHKGEVNAVTSRELECSFQMRGSELRREINALRGDGIPICSFEGGYPENWQRHSYVACCGTSIQPVLQMLEQAPQLGTILLCLDNDEAGHQASRRMREQLDARYSVERLIPENKDWNDDLTLSGGNAQGFSMNEMR